MIIRKTTREDLPKVMELYAGARKFMKEHGNPNQWGPTNWPPESLICEDIQNGHSYVCIRKVDGEILGTFYFNAGVNIEPTYKEIDGAWIGGEEYGVVHRIAADSSTHGVGRFCMEWALERCGHLRIDTHPDNHVMQSFLTKMGFVKCGIIHVVEDDNPRYAYERV